MTPTLMNSRDDPVENEDYYDDDEKDKNDEEDEHLPWFPRECRKNL